MAELRHWINLVVYPNKSSKTYGQSSISEVSAFVIPHSWKHSQLPLQKCTSWEEESQTLSEYVVPSV